MSTENAEIDDHDSRILAELQRDARISMAELGRRVHLSQPAVTERVRKLELQGVIRGYRAVLDPARLGYGFRALLRCGRVDQARMAKAVEQTPEVLQAWHLAGADSWMLEIAVIDVEHLDAVLTRFGMLADTSTSIVLNMPREHAALVPARRETVKPPTRKVTGR